MIKPIGVPVVFPSNTLDNNWTSSSSLRWVTIAAVSYTHLDVYKRQEYAVAKVVGAAVALVAVLVPLVIVVLAGIVLGTVAILPLGFW